MNEDNHVGPHVKYCRRILKQYGKHIKAFDNRINKPIESKRSPKGDRRIDMPYFLKKGSKIDSYETLVYIANNYS